MFLLLLAGAARADCPASAADLAAAVRSVERAFGSLDAAGVAEGGRRIELYSACLDVTIDPDLAARVHAAAGLVAFVAGDERRAEAAFAAARRVDPRWAPDATLVPKGHPIRTLAYGLDPTRLGTEVVPEPARGELCFDGVVGGTRPVGTPTVAQWRVDGAVVSGAYVWPDAPLPPYDLPDRPSTSPLGAWLGVGAAGAVASLGSFYVAGRARQAWETAPTGLEAQAHYRENHALVGLGATFGAVAAVGAVGAVATVAF